MLPHFWTIKNPTIAPGIFSLVERNIRKTQQVTAGARIFRRQCNTNTGAYNYLITADLAISEAQKADYSVFLIAGVDENKCLHIKNVIRDRLDGREIVDTLLSLQRIYEPEAIGIEQMQVSQAIGPFLREEMVASNTFISLVPLKHMGKDKTTRARSIQARMRAKGVIFDKDGDWYPSFEDECLTFPRVIS